jgi:hypothetical protein
MPLGLAGSITKTNTQSLVEEIQCLRKSSAAVEALQRTNVRLQNTVDTLLEELGAVRHAAAVGDNIIGIARQQSPSTVKEERGLSSGLEDFGSSAGGARTCACGKDGKLPIDQCVGNDGEPPRLNYRKLVEQHNTLVRYNKSLCSARDDLEKKLRDVLALARHWMNYAQALEKKVYTLKATLSSQEIPLDKDSGELLAVKSIAQPVLSSVSAEVNNLGHQSPDFPQSSPMLDGDTIVATPEKARNELGPSHDDPRGEFGTSCSPTLPKHPETPLSNRGKFATTNSHSFPNQLHYSSSTQGDVENNDTADEHLVVGDTAVNCELSPDSPVVLYSRSVKRRKNGKNGEGPASVEPKVKVEVISSSPVGRAILSDLECHESQDLDDIGEKYDTPKKKRQRPLQADNTWLANKYAVNIKDCYTQQMEHSKQGEVEKAKLIPGSSVLRPSSPNVRILPQISEKEGRRKRRRLDDCVQKSEHLIEDSENYLAVDRTSEIDTQIGRVKQALFAAASKKDSCPTDSLERSQPSKLNLARARGPRSPLEESLDAQYGITDRMDKAIPSSGQRVVNAGIGPDALQDIVETPGTPSNTGKVLSRSAEAKDSRPLRERPLQELSIEHFKVNPKYNQGYDYAFADVVRGRQQRRCLPGCTKPECCGVKFQKFVELTRIPDGERRESQEERDRHLLEEYMGDNRDKLRTMCQSEKEQIMIRAKARELANKTGKHRQAYERRLSPPGFWRVDFPDTQETKLDRLEAAKLERELVCQRYEEALRPGGKWIFRDE